MVWEGEIMRVNDVDYPNLLVEAIRDDRLVIFAGAGVSMSKPTNLPSFNNLSKKLLNLQMNIKEKMNLTNNI